MAVPTTQQVLIGIGLTPACENFDMIVKFFDTFVSYKLGKYRNKKMMTKTVYEDVCKDFDCKYEWVEIVVRQTMKKAYKKTHFKYLFAYFNLELETGFKPTTTELANLLTLIEKDRRREEKASI